MARIHALLVLSTNLLEIPLLADGRTGEAISAATVVATLLDADAVEVAGQDWPLTLSEDPETPGRYSGTLEADLEVAAGDLLSGVITAQKGQTQRTFHLDIEAQRG